MKSILALLCLLVASASATSWPEAVKAVGTTFPFCACDVTTTASPYALTRFRVVKLKKTIKLCWRVNTTTAASGPCSKFDLRKIEIDVNPDCRGTVVGATWNKKTLSTSWQAYPEVGALALKVLKPDAEPIATFKSLTRKTPLVCIEVKKGTCGSPASFCVGGACKWSIFSPDLKCCPTGM